MCQPSLFKVHALIALQATMPGEILQATEVLRKFTVVADASIRALCEGIFPLVSFTDFCGRAHYALQGIAATASDLISGFLIAGAIFEINQSLRMQFLLSTFSSMVCVVATQSPGSIDHTVTAYKVGGGTEFYRPSGAFGAFFTNVPMLMEIRAGKAVSVLFDNMNSEGKMHVNHHFYKKFTNSSGDDLYEYIKGVAVVVY